MLGGCNCSQCSARAKKNGVNGENGKCIDALKQQKITKCLESCRVFLQAVSVNFHLSMVQTGIFETRLELYNLGTLCQSFEILLAPVEKRLDLFEGLGLF